MTSRWLVRRTLATLRSAEFGFFGVVGETRVQTPRFCGFCSIAGTLDLAFCGSRPLRISWLIVGIGTLHLSYSTATQNAQDCRGGLYRPPRPLLPHAAVFSSKTPFGAASGLSAT